MILLLLVLLLVFLRPVARTASSTVALQLLMPRCVGPHEKYKPKDTLFPVELSDKTKLLLQDSVDLAFKVWTGNGRLMLEELDADEKLARACEKAPLDDEILQALRDAYNAMVKEYKVIPPVQFRA